MITAISYATAALSKFTHPSIGSSSNPHIQNIALNALGLLITVFSLLPPVTATSSALAVNPNCLTHNCPDLKEDQLHDWEKSAIKVLDESWCFSSSFPTMQEYLRLRADDPIDKCLWLTAEASHNGALDPKENSHLLSPLAKAADLKFQTVSTFSDICNAIEDAAKTGRLTSVFISAHGSSKMLLLSKDYQHRIDEGLDFKNCFKDLQPSGTIILMSCSTGARNNNGDPYDNIAQKLATAAQRTVIAATDILYLGRVKILSTDPLELFASISSWSYLTNIFRKFYPGCESIKSLSTNPNCICPPCVDLDEKKVHPREIEAAKVIYSRSHWGVGTFKERQEYLRLSRDDVKEKVLYLVAEYDDIPPPNYMAASDPRAASGFLGIISKEFDLKYKVVKSYKEICQEIKDTVNLGKLAHVIINGHGNPETICLSKCNSWPRESIERSEDFSSCFSNLEPSGKIILSSCNVGSPQWEDSYNNLAQTIADKTHRVVIAAKSFSYTNEIHVISLDPFMVFHTSEKHTTHDIPNINTYRMFRPQYSNGSSVSSD